MGLDIRAGRKSCARHVEAVNAHTPSPADGPAQHASHPSLTESSVKGRIPSNAGGPAAVQRSGALAPQDELKLQQVRPVICHRQ